MWFFLKNTVGNNVIQSFGCSSAIICTGTVIAWILNDVTANKRGFEAFTFIVKWSGTYTLILGSFRICHGHAAFDSGIHPII